MAGDWIKITKDLSNKPEVRKMSRMLSIPRPQVVGHLVAFWSWVDSNSETGIDIDLTKEDVDDITDFEGFADALVKVGWLSGRESRFAIPHFDRHVSQSAKARALEAEAKRIRRSQGKEGEEDILSDICPTFVGHNVGPEKRREECNNKEEKNKGGSGLFSVEEIARTNIPKPSFGEPLPKSIEEVRKIMESAPEHPQGDALDDCAEWFWTKYETRGWLDDQGIPMRKWKALARRRAKSWVRNPLNYQQKGPGNVRTDAGGVKKKWE